MLKINLEFIWVRKMAICPECSNRYYGVHCDMCGHETSYSCWNCRSTVTPMDSECSSCHWFTCSECGECGCNPDRPRSNEEKEDGVEPF